MLAEIPQQPSPIKPRASRSETPAKPGHVNTRTVDVHSPAAATSALRVFFNIAEHWGLSVSEQQTLLGVGKTTFFAWKSGKVRAGLDPDVLERLSYIFGIFGALEILLPIPERANAWVKKPNSSPLFGGDSALRRMLGGRVGDLMVVHSYLDAQRGGDFA